MAVNNDTVSLQRVQQVFRRCCQDDYSLTAEFREFPTAGLPRTYSFLSAKRLQYMRQFCLEFFERTTDPTRCFAEMDELYSQQLKCNIRKWVPERISDESAVRGAYALLQRLPKTSTVLPDFDSVRTASRAQEIPPWEDLDVASSLSQNVIYVAFLAAHDLVRPDGSQVNLSILHLINTTAEMIEVSSMLSAEATDVSQQRRWLLVRAFMWTSWQRMVFMYLHQIQGATLRQGYYDYREELDYMLRRTVPAPEKSLQDMSRDVAQQEKSEYMCSWAMELVRAQDVSIAADFRNFHRAFSECFKGHGSRCNPGEGDASDVRCDGSRPDRCRRFIGMDGVEDQSAHDETCTGNCKKVYWNKLSYLDCGRPQAVPLLPEGQQPSELTYVPVTEKTLTISHVWIAGMGGRPEHGFNTCLYQRWVKIARQLGCDSFWMDTVCVPDDEKLRDLAINDINTVFYRCGTTLVCDRDLMAIDVAGTALESLSGTSGINAETVKRSEQILATLLVCDWNVRAWTYLESIKGRRNLQILCKNNKLVSFLDVVRVVHEFGHVDVSILAIASGHLFPSRRQVNQVEKEMGSWKEGDALIPIGQAGAVLSYRPARKEKNEVQIWSLLVRDEEAFSDPAEFWLSRQNTRLQTGFLMSSSPRLNLEGLSWAPRTPNAMREKERNHGAFYRAYDGEETSRALITAEGLRGAWKCFVFRLSDDKPTTTFRSAFSRLSLGREQTERKSFVENHPADFVAECAKIEAQFLAGYKYALLIQPKEGSAPRLPAHDIWWALRPTLTTPTPYDQSAVNQSAVQYRGSIKGSLFAVCGSNGAFSVPNASRDGQLTPIYASSAAWPEWSWKGLYEWPANTTLPGLREHEVLIA